MKKQIVVKISHPKNWINNGHWDFLYHTEDGLGKWGNYFFDVNGDSEECDFWFVYGDLDAKEIVYCQPDHIFYITSEEKSQILSYPQKYLNQFYGIITSRDDIQHSNINRMQYLCPWNVRKTYSELLNNNITKIENLSAIISNSTWLDGHKKRYAFINKLKGHFKEKLDWYAKGENFISDKWDGLAPYKYSIAIENSDHFNYFTEKIMDVFLALSMPIYWGCPNITDYFPDKSMILIDINDYKKSIQQIEQAIECDLHTKNFQYICQAKELVLKKNQFIAGISNFLDKLPLKSTPKKKNIIYPIKHFTQTNIINKITKKIKHNFG